METSHLVNDQWRPQVPSHNWYNFALVHIEKCYWFNTNCFRNRSPFSLCTLSHNLNLEKHFNWAITFMQGNPDKKDWNQCSYLQRIDLVNWSSLFDTICLSFHIMKAQPCQLFDLLDLSAITILVPQLCCPRRTKCYCWMLQYYLHLVHWSFVVEHVEESEAKPTRALLKTLQKQSIYLVNKIWLTLSVTYASQPKHAICIAEFS